MKTGKSSVAVFCLATALASGGALAQSANRSQSAQPAQSSMAQSTQSGQSMNEIRLSKLQGLQVKTANGRNFAKLSDLMIDPTSGKIKFAVLGEGGFFGLGQKLIPVPWQDITQASGKQLTVNLSKQKLLSAPQLTRNYLNLNNPNFVARVDQYYSVPSSAIGGAATPSGAQQGAGAKQQSSGANRQNANPGR